MGEYVNAALPARAVVKLLTRFTCELVYVGGGVIQPFSIRAATDIHP